MAGLNVVHLVEKSQSAISEAIAATSSRRHARRNMHTAALTRALKEAEELRTTLLNVSTNGRKEGMDLG